jgi:hypothetical protein
VGDQDPDRGPAKAKPESKERQVSEKVIVRHRGQGRTVLVGGADHISYKVRTAETDGAFFCFPDRSGVHPAGPEVRRSDPSFGTANPSALQSVVASSSESPGSRLHRRATPGGRSARSSARAPNVPELSASAISSSLAPASARRREIVARSDSLYPRNRSRATSSSVCSELASAGYPAPPRRERS